MLTGLAFLATAFLAGCMAPRVWPDYKRSAEDKIVVIQEKIGDGLKTGTLSPDQSQMFLTTLKGIRTDDLALRDRPVDEEKWLNLHTRLDALGGEIDRTIGRQAATEDPRNGDRILLLQSRIDDGRVARRWSQINERDFQYRLDTIRHDYLRMTEAGRTASFEDRAAIAGRLDSLETDLNRSR
jgi:hypothetical protein